ncbi:histidine phosphatase family protein [Sphingomonas rubra]|uniref:Probable phosphoglycerate mutase n=1 Tax=Sphingomonas rubra TaxID=634430 RepID=A0A1I5T5Y6_9SPHN|nr:histidine phosphatase family protein [Sphingomonas rubra]SFP78231.1 probable phosphoglycerate mutase [Sphingomonas rubra]
MIARHGETVFNAAARFQGTIAHTPLTRAGIAQADAIGQALRRALGPTPRLTLWASPTGRALQTLAIVVEHLALDWHAVRTDERLAELDFGGWGGRTYAEIVAEAGPIVRADGLVRPAPDGERYASMAARLAGWIADSDAEGDRLIVMHGLSSRVLRGLLTGRAADGELGAPIGDSLPQGSAVMVERGVEQVIHRGTGAHGGKAPA